MDFEHNKSMIFKYSDIFFTHLFNNDVKCNRMSREHALVYVYSGEMLLEEVGRGETRVHKSECAFIRRDNRITMTKQPKGDEQYQGIFMTFQRNFLRNMYRKIDRKTLPLNTQNILSA
ncbi:MAG: hypothetical protein LBT25_03755 [Candidatus Symbiothrix sp.]|nr:hypothetical protein [Candidatus Symbiothrix sp.]